jgi:hypothetical protein
VKEAFAFGEEYCKAVTASNPPPVQLKLEKVYAGCLLQTVCETNSVSVECECVAVHYFFLSEKEILWNDVRICFAEAPCV